MHCDMLKIQDGAAIVEKLNSQTPRLKTGGRYSKGFKFGALHVFGPEQLAHPPAQNSRRP